MRTEMGVAERIVTVWGWIWMGERGALGRGVGDVRFADIPSSCHVRITVFVGQI